METTISRKSKSLNALLLAISLLASSIVLIPAVSAKASLDALLIPGTDFNSGTTGWDTSGGVTAEGTQIQINNNAQNNWVYTTNGAKSGRLQPQASNTFSTVLQSSLGLTSTEVTAVRAAFSGSPTNSAFTFRTVTLEAGVTYRMAWSYTSTDYAPYNDGSLTTLVPVSGNPTITVNNSAKRWALLGFTVPPTGIYSTGDYGSTGWQIATYQVDTTGEYKLGFSVFNIGDTAMSPVLIIDDERGSVTRSGVPFGAVAPNDSSAPNIATSVSPSSQTVTGTPGVAITSTSVLTASGLNGTVTFSSGTLPTGLTLNTSTGVVSGTPTATSTATVTITATGSTSGTATSSMIFSIKNAQAPLVLSSTEGTQGTPLALSVTGGSGTGSVSYSVTNGTATGCTISGGNLSASSPGTCLVTATKAADASYTVVSSTQTAVTFIGRPGAPTIDSITSTDDGISIAFTAPASTGGSPITNYMYSLDDGQTFVAFSPAQVTSPLLVTGLVGGTTYDVKIRAVNVVGEGTASTKTAITYLAKPGAPTIGSITSGNQELSITFTAPTSDGGAPITNYMYSLDNGVTFVSFSPAQTTSPLRITNLIAGTSYSVKILAINSVGQGTSSATVVGSTIAPPSAAPIAPTRTSQQVVTPSPTPTVGPQPGTAQRPAELQRPAPNQVLSPVLQPRVIDLSPSLSSTATPTPSPTGGLSSSVTLPPSTALSLVPGPDSEKRVAEIPTSVLVNGVNQSSRIIVVRETISQVVTTDGGLLSVEAQSGGNAIPVDSLGRVQMVRNDSVQAEGQGMAPESEFAVYLFSEPTLIGLGRADSSGKFYVTFPVGFDLPLGEHTLQVVGINSTGDQLAVSMPVVVVESKADALEQAKAEPVMVTADEPNPIQDLVYLMIIVGLLATLFLFILWRRRKKDQPRYSEGGYSL